MSNLLFSKALSRFFLSETSSKISLTLVIGSQIIVLRPYTYEYLLNYLPTHHAIDIDWLIYSFSFIVMLNNNVYFRQFAQSDFFYMVGSLKMILPALLLFDVYTYSYSFLFPSPCWLVSCANALNTLDN